MSNLGTLNWKDLVKGLAVAVIMAILTIAYEEVATEGAFNWKKIGIAAFGAGLAYLIKNLGTNFEGKLLGKI